MTRTLSLAVRCLYLCILGCLLTPVSLHAEEVNAFPSNYLPNDTLFFSITDCQATIEICIEDLSLIELTNIMVSVNGEAYLQTFKGCNFDTTSAYTYSTLFGEGESGPYELLVWRVEDTVFTGVFNTIPDLVDSMNLWDPRGNWILNDTTQFISGGHGETSYSDMAVQVVAIDLPSFIGYNFGVEANGVQLSFGEGIHNVSILDTLNNTIRKAVVVVGCTEKTFVKRRVLPNETNQYCLDFSDLLTEVAAVEFCNNLSQESARFELMNNDSCVNFTGIEVGFDTACVLTCDAFGYCDSTFIIVETYDELNYREATINLIAGTTQKYCLDTNVLLTPINYFVNDCPTKSGEAADVTLDSSAYCVSIEGILPGQDTTCTVICNQFGQCDTTIFHITVFPAPIVETINVMMTLGDTLDICLETAELTGIVTSIDDFCENNSTETIISDINNVDLCIQTSAVTLGTDSICAVICDNFLICDTTYYLFTVVSSTPSLTATPDLDTTSINSLITINVLGNDSVPDGIITEMEIVPPSELSTNGTAIIKPDGTIDYNPALDFCGASDNFQYRICNDVGCDTATVAVFVTCPDPRARRMTIYTGFSPNGDGVNDYFKIEGIAQFPNNEISIFNRWGTKVFNQRGYKNAWDGTWNNKILPDGTYFYILKDGEGKKYSGYVQINP